MEKVSFEIAKKLKVEDFVTFEIAKKLKEKGFPQHITDEAYIVDNYGEDECDIGDRMPIQLIPDYMDDVAAPTISQVLKWLREEKRIHIVIVVCSIGWFYDVYHIEQNKSLLEESEDDIAQSYELAAIAGIEYCLDNLI